MPDTHYFRTPWTTDDVLDRCAYVLLREYVSPAESDSPVAFYAIVGRGRDLISVTHEEIGNFLEQHRERTFITFDAVKFHHRCLESVSDPRRRSLVWRLSKNSRLWDVGMIERRCCYIHSGRLDFQIDDESLRLLYCSRVDTRFDSLETSKKVGLLRKVIIKQLDWTLQNFPVFKSAWGGIVTSGVVRGEPDRCRNDHYLWEISFLANASIQSELSNRPGPDHITFESLRVKRRQYLLLSAPHGPLGVGLDLQAALLAEALDQNAVRLQSDRLLDIAQNLLDRIHANFQKREPPVGGPSPQSGHGETPNNPSRSIELSGCFKWTPTDDHRFEVKRNRDGFIRKNDERFRGFIEHLFDNITRNFRERLDIPRDRQTGNPSSWYADWLSYRNYFSAIKTWVDLEVAGLVKTACRNKQNPLGRYRSFPALCNLIGEVLADVSEEPFLHDRERYLAEIRFDDLELRSILATNVALYGILPEMEGEYDEQIYGHSFVDYLIAGLENTFVRACGYRNRDGISDIIDSLYSAWRSWSDDQKADVIRTVVRGCMFQESTEQTRARLEESEIYATLPVLTIFRSFVWNFFISCRRPGFPRPHQQSVTGHFSPRVELLQSGYGAADFADDIENENRFTDWPFTLTLDQICSKTRLSRFRIQRILENRIGQADIRQAWTVINHLDNIAENVRPLIEEAILSIKPLNTADLDLDSLYRTNSVSSLGRVGPTIHYANALSVDYKLFQQDLPMTVAFSLLASGCEVVWVSQHSIVVRLRPGNEQAQQSAIAGHTRLALTKAFQTASVTGSDFADWLARGAFTCRIVDSWPNGTEVHPHDPAFSGPELKRAPELFHPKPIPVFEDDDDCYDEDDFWSEDDEA